MSIPGDVAAYSDTEYAARVSGSKSLPKKSSALNYGLLLGQIQQKRQQRQKQSRGGDGSVSDSNYTSYQDIQGMRTPRVSSNGHYGGWARSVDFQMELTRATIG